MNFQEFLAAKQALALVEHMETLSEQDAQQLFDTLDEETIEFIEAVLSETSAGTLKKLPKRGLSPKTIAAAKKNYKTRGREEDNYNDRVAKGQYGIETRDKDQKRRRSQGEQVKQRSAQGQPEDRDIISQKDLASRRDVDDIIHNIKSSRNARLA